MELSRHARTIFSGQIKPRGDAHVVEVPEQELSLGAVEAGETYRIAILPPVSDESSTRTHIQTSTSPPVDEGDKLEVDIEDEGEQGDGIARIGPGYVVFVPGTSVGDTVEIEISDVRDNFAFGEVVGDDSEIA